MTALETAKPCHWVKDADVDMVFIPGCWGAVHHPAHCTCGVGGSRLERSEAGRTAAEREIERLRERRARQRELYLATHRRSQRLHARMRELEAQLHQADQLKDIRT